MLARKLACPSCSVRLKVEETLAAGTVIKCPKCGKGFPVPGANGAPPKPKALAAVRARNVAPPPETLEEEEPEEEVEEQPAPRKFRKKRKKKSGNMAVVWGL